MVGNVQADRLKKGKGKIKVWDRMVSKLKHKLLPMEYMISLYRKLQNLRLKEMSIKEFIK